MENEPTGAVWPRILVALCVVGGALAYLGDAVSRSIPRDAADFTFAVAAVAVGGVALLYVLLSLARHFRALRPALDRVGAEAETPDRSRHHHDSPTRPGPGEISAVLRCIDHPALVIGERGGITLMNPAAVTFLDPLGLPRWASIHELLDADDLRQAVFKARGAGRPVRVLLRSRLGGEFTAKLADLGLRAGAILVLEGTPSTADASGDAPSGAEIPAPARPGGRWGVAIEPTAPVATLPMLALRFELTDGRLTGVSTVRLTGGRVFNSFAADFPIRDPSDEGGGGHPESGRPLVEAWPAISDALRGVVVVAENAALTWAVLTDARAAAGFPHIEPPPMVDLGRLAARWNPEWAGLDAAALAERLDIAEPIPARRLARVAATLVLGPDGGGVGTFGELAGELAESQVRA